MSDYVLFQMWKPYRQSLIDGHLFYVEQAQKRLLSQFGDIEAEADQYGEAKLEEYAVHYNPDADNGAELQEAAYEKMCAHYQMLDDMRSRTRLSVIAGMFHEWDKHLRDWLTKEIRHWHHGDAAASKVWSADFVNITDLLECLGWKIRAEPYFSKLDACRLVVNVYKHGEGKSLEDLKRDFPEYLDRPCGNSASPFSMIDFLDHAHLNVNDDQFLAFSDAIVAFWKGVPENVCASQVTAVPDWFEKVVSKDRKQS